MHKNKLSTVTQWFNMVFEVHPKGLHLFFLLFFNYFAGNWLSLMEILMLGSGC